MRIDIYTLLGLVKDGKAPKKIKFGNIELEYSEENEDYFQYYGQGLFEYKFGNYKNFLNDKVTIIEETKKIPEKIDLAWQNSFDEQVQQDCVKMIIKNINEIIDYLKSKVE